MDRLIAPNTVASGAADIAPLTGTPAYATQGNPATTTPATVFPAYQYNAIQEELMAIILAAGITPDRTNNAQVLAAIRSLMGAGRLRLVSDTTFYVNEATGSDANNGLTTGTAWLTRQHAVNYVSNNVDINGFNCTIQIMDGTYTDTLSINLPFLGGIVNMIGNLATPANCIIAPASNNCIFLGGPMLINIGGFKLEPPSGASSIEVRLGAVATITGPMEYAAGTQSHLDAQFDGRIIVAAPYKISGGASAHISAQNGGKIAYTTSETVTLTGTPAFTDFATATDQGLINCPSSLITFSGGATGARYSSISNAVIDTAGGGGSFFPGSTAGSSGTGGEYV